MQGKDNLEKFVSENREEFDDRTPQRDVWSAIDQNLRTEIRPQATWCWKVVVVILLGAVSFLLYDKYSIQTQTLAEIESVEESNVDKFQNLESFYTAIISKKETKLNEELAGNDQFYNYRI